METWPKKTVTLAAVTWTGKDCPLWAWASALTKTCGVPLPLWQVPIARTVSNPGISNTVSYPEICLRHLCAWWFTELKITTWCLLVSPQDSDNFLWGSDRKYAGFILLFSLSYFNFTLQTQTNKVQWWFLTLLWTGYQYNDVGFASYMVYYYIFELSFFSLSHLQINFMHILSISWTLLDV